MLKSNTTLLRSIIIILLLVSTQYHLLGQHLKPQPITPSEWELLLKMPSSIQSRQNINKKSLNTIGTASLDTTTGWDNQFALNGILGLDVYAAKMGNGKLYIGGEFEAVGTVVANKIAMWDGEKWNPMGEGLNGPVYAIYVNEMNDDVFVGGMFTHSGTQEMNYLAQWNGEEWQFVGKTPNDIKGVEVAPYINVLEGSSGFIGNTTLYVGGSFDHVDNVAGTSYLAKWDGHEWEGIGGGTDRLVTALCNYGGYLFAGGFGSFGGVNNMAFWDGNVWNKMGEIGPNDAASSFYSDGDNMYVGGFFTEIDDKPLQFIAQYDMVNNQWHRLGYEEGKPEPEYDQLDQSVRSIGRATADALLIGGYFEVAGNTELNHIGYFSFEDLSFHPINKGVDNVVRALICSDQLYAFGSFRGVNRGLFENNTDVTYGVTYCEINYEDLSNTTWKAFENTTFNGVYSSGERLIEKDGKIYMVGLISYAGSQPTNFIARWNGQTWEKLADGLHAGWINDLVVIGDDLYVGGFLAVNADEEFVCPLVARWDGTVWQPLGYGLAGTINSQVFALETDGTSLYVGGVNLYQAINPDKSIINIGNIARWNGQTWSSMGELDLVHGIVYSLEFHEGKLFAGGYLTNAGQETLNHLAYWNGEKWVKEGNFEASVFSLRSNNNKLYAGGEFDKAIRVLDNNEWKPVGGGLSESSWVSDIEVVNNKVLTAGYIEGDNEGNALSNIVYFDGEAWNNLGGGSSWIVKDILPQDNKFYIAGYAGILGGKVPYSGFSVWQDQNNEIVLGMPSLDSEALLRLLIYPNPSNGETMVAVPNDIQEKGIFSITDISGRLIKAGAIEEGSRTLEINISKPGIYMVRICDSKHEYTGKMLVE